jgi:hypothetical protein
MSKLQGHVAAGKIRQIEKLSMTSAGFDYATFRLVAQCLNHVRYRRPVGIPDTCANIENDAT